MRSVPTQFVLAASLCVVTIGCNKPPRDVAAVEPVPVAAVETPQAPPPAPVVPQTMPPQVATPPVASAPVADPAIEIDRYLSWLSGFEKQRMEVSRQTEGYLSRSIQIQQGGGDGTQSSEAARRFIMGTYPTIVTRFQSESKPPAECAALATAYGTYLQKGTRAIMELYQQNQSGAAPDTGTIEVAQANAEIERLYREHPGLTTPRFRVE